MSRAAWDVGRSIRRHLLLSGIAAVLLVGGVGGWSATTELAGAVVAAGTVVVASSVKKVQHLTGGIVGELRVQDGQVVRAGDVLIRLDETVTQANLAAVENSLIELYARAARLEGERDGAERISTPASLAEYSDNKRAADMMAGEQRLFELRRTARTGQKAQLQERIAQLEEEIRGLKGQIAGKKREIELIFRELEGVRELWNKKLVPLQRVTALERDAARLEGEHGQLIAAVAQAKGKISETELQIIQIDQDLRSEVAREIGQVQSRIAELIEKRVAAMDQLKRIDIRAPQDGIVHQLSVHTIGGVIGPGETLMMVIPRADRLVVEARVSPKDVDQLRVGQPAILRFTAFNQRTTPEVDGEVSFVAGDQSLDEKTGAPYFKIQIAPDDKQLSRAAEVKLVPGMPVESFIRTGSRTVLSYLVKPLNDQINRAFRDD